MTKDELIAFEEEIAELFNAGLIPHPVHLSNDNETALIDIFKDIRRYDWVCGSWRMHYQCLLHGVPSKTLKAAIMHGDSMSLCFPEHRIVSSAIVGGILPIATGIALGIARRGEEDRVHCFAGDMTAQGGMFHECSRYAANHQLPIRWIIEDNGKSVCTPTIEAWGASGEAEIVRYDYCSKWPHSGAGIRVQF
jgi:pyruvate dehydrogenase E1 component alpha subunit